MGVHINGATGNVIATKGTFSGNVGIAGTLTYEDVTDIDAVGLITARNGIEIGASPGVGASISRQGNAIFSGITTIGSKEVGAGITLSPDGDVFATGVCTATSFSGDGSNLTGLSGVSVANQSDNRVITNTGTTDALNAEANLTFDGTNLTVGTGNFVTGASAKGLDLSAQDISSGITTAAFVNASRTGTITSEIFDHYEEGTFIPDLLYCAQPTYTSRSGRYTRIGNLVYISISLDISSMGSAGSDGSVFTIGGIPYTHHDQGNLSNSVALFSFGYNTTLLGSQIDNITSIRMTNKGDTPPPDADVNYTGGLQFRDGSGGVSYNVMQSSGTLQFAAMYMVFV